MGNTMRFMNVAAVTVFLLSASGARAQEGSDAGKAAYKTLVHPTHIGDKAPLYRHVKPEGSRADVRAKGVWRDGMWTVEFARKLVTGNADDIQFDVSRIYQFGVSRFEVAGRRKNPKLEEPYFGAGEITEPLTLRFK